MKTNKIMGALALGTVLVLSSCIKEKMVDEGQITILKASIEQPYDTRTELSGPDGGRYKTLWVENDAIGVFDGGSAVTEFCLAGGAGTAAGEFKGVLFTGDIVAVYPFSICESISGKTVSVSLPQEQNYKEGNIADGAYPMVAVSSNTSLNFKNLCSVLKVSMTGSLKVNYISFLPNDADVKVAGAATISADSSAPQLQVSESGTGFVKLVCPSVALSGTATDFYIVVPARKYPGGFSLKINTDKGDVVKSIKTDVTLSRSQLYRIAPFECKMDESGKYILFEDKNFESYLIANFDADGDGAISYDEALAIEKIEVNTDNISSLAGIEYMTNLQWLVCKGSYRLDSDTGEYVPDGILKYIDISKNTKLYNVNVRYNLLTSLDLSNNIELLYLDCSCNQLSSLDVSNNTGLLTLECGDNQISSLDVNHSPKLQHLSCFSNQLTSLDVSNNIKLQRLSCTSNQIPALDISNNPELGYLSCFSNKLSSLDLSACTQLQWLECSNNELSSLDVSNNPKLQNLQCYGNKLSSLDLSSCTQLKQLVCHENNLTSLKLGPSTVLGTVYCYTNSLTTLDISKNTGLQLLSAVYNPLKTLYIYEGQLSDIPNLYLPDGYTAVVGSEPDGGGDEQFSVSPTSFDIDGEEQDITVTVTASMEYSLNSTPDWISQKSVSSGTYTFTVSENSSSSARSGSIVFKNVSGSALAVTVSQGIKTYTSSDYSQDGIVTCLQSSTVGKGIDVVFVGDAFADKDQELFNKYVNLGMEAFFTEEPFKSTKDRFNIYRIGSVSKNGIITQEGGDTKFSAEFGQGTNISGNNKAVFGFVQENMPSVDLTKTIIFVIINKAQYAGTCWMYSNNQAICYVPLCRDENDYAQTLRHEGCGHGFGKLADEYSYTSQGTIPEDKGNDLKQWRSFAYGFYENVDLTSDPATILWSRFISDSRYSGKVGVYEGGYTYPYGVYRPTENSIMRHNTGGFNAPSREAIYKKIMRFSEGGTWTYDYEAFVEFDSPARSAEAITRAAAQCAAIDESSFIPLAPPVMVMADE